MKRHIKGWILLVAAFAALDASELTYYSDEVHYRPDGTERFVGFDPATRVLCEGRPVATVPALKAPAGCTLCGVYTALSAARERESRAASEIRFLKAGAEKASYRNATAEQIVTDAALFAEKLNGLEEVLREAKMQIASGESLFSQAGLRPDASPVFMASACERPTLVIPAYKLNIEPRYAARILSSGTEVEVTEMLRFRNRSGVDIHAKSGTFLTYPLHESMRRLRFSPWRINAKPPVPLVRASAADAGVEKRLAAEAPKAPRVSRLSAKRYALRDLVLPADGSQVSAEAGEWRFPAKREAVVYPYLDTRLYVTYLFEPETRLLADRWDVTEGETLQENTFGHYEGKRYRLYASIDREVRITRKQSIHRDSDPLFSGPKRRDGYSVELTNLSSQAKTLHIVDRIPVSDTEAIEVGNLQVTPKGTAYRLGKEGRIDMDVTLPPHGLLTIGVTFVVAHEKGEEVVY